MRTMSASPDCNVTARRNGGVTLRTSWHASSPRWSLTIRCLGEATSGSSQRCRRIVVQATTPMPSGADSGCGKTRMLVRSAGLVPSNRLEGPERMPQMVARSETPRTRSTIKHAAWQALEAHYETMRGLHLRNLFADDPTRGERMTAEAAGVHLDYSKNRINDETLKLLIDLA